MPIPCLSDILLASQSAFAPLRLASQRYLVPADTTTLTGQTVAEGRFAMRAPKGGLVRPRLVWSHLVTQNPSHPNGELLPVNSYTVEAAIEFGGSSTRFTWAGGLTNWTVAPNDNDLRSDAINMTVPANGDYWIRFRCELVSGTFFNRRQAVNGSTGAQFVVHSTTTNQVTATGALTTPSGGSGSATSGFGPVGVLGEGNHNAVVIVGDSIAEGTNFDTADSTGAIGFVAKGLVSVGGFRVPWTNLARGGERADTFRLNSPRRLFLTRLGTDVISNHGTNDIDQSRGLAALQADYSAIAAAVKTQGLRFHAVALFPRQASGGTYTTLAGQTPRAGFETGGIRDQFNSWLAARVTAGEIDSVIDCNAGGAGVGLADAGDPSRFAIDGGALTADGTHLNNTGATRAAARVNAWAVARGLA